jgi:hypothetical protein
MSLPSFEPPADPAEANDGQERQGFQAVAERASRRARAFRNVALLVLLASFTLSAGTCFVAFLPGAWPGIGQAVGIVGIVQLVIASIAALLLFIFAAEQRALAARNRPSERLGSRRGRDLDADAEGLRRSATAYGRWLPVAKIVAMLAKIVAILFGILLGAACLIPLAIAIARGAVDWSDLEGLSKLAQVIVGALLLVVFLFAFPARWLEKRRKARQRQAELVETCASLSLRYLHRPVEGHLEPFASLPLFRHGRRFRGQAVHLMTGKMAGWPIQLLVYGYDANRLGSKDQRTRQTVLLTRMDLPVRTDRLETFLKDHGGLVLESAEGWLAVYRPGQVWEVGQYPERIAEALPVCDLLRPAPPP